MTTVFLFSYRALRGTQPHAERAVSCADKLCESLDCLQTGSVTTELLLTSQEKQMNNFLKGIIGASIALTLAGGAQAAGQENAAATAQDKAMDSTTSTTTATATPKAKKTKAKKAKPSTSTGASGSGQTGASGNAGNGSAEGAGTMNGVGKTSQDGGTPQTTNGK
jgi:hypothetical protein